MYTVQLKLYTSKFDKLEIDKRFHSLSHIHNVIVKHAKKLMASLTYNKEYQQLLTELQGLKSSRSKGDDLQVTANRKRINARLNQIRTDIGLTEYGLQAYAKVCARQFKKQLSSQQVQKEASHVWSGVCEVLYKDGRQLHFKKYGDFDTISGKSNINGVKFNADTCSIDWLGLQIPCMGAKDNPYITQALRDTVSYCTIKRMMFPSGWRYYVILTMKETAPKKQVIGTGRIGIDPGVSTIAAASDDTLILEELSPKTADYEHKIHKLQYHMDASRRLLNPNKYNSDGTIKRGNRDRWIFSKTCLRNRRKLKSLYRQMAACRKCAHHNLANRILAQANHIIIEKMDYKALAKRNSRIAERDDKASSVKQKDGTSKIVYKFRKKKRFGHSVGSRAPALFVSILEYKCKQYDCIFQKIDTAKFKASQYDHVCKEYMKAPLSARSKQIGISTVQRDLYSAYLIKNSNPEGTAPVVYQCENGFEKFVAMQNDLIMDMRAHNISMKQCFGF